MIHEYEVTWGMVYEASSPADAVRQALGDLADVAANPSIGPNIFVVRNMSEEKPDDVIIDAGSASSEYWCAVCDTSIGGDDIEDRHSTSEGEDCHERCCVTCALEGLS